MNNLISELSFVIGVKPKRKYILNSFIICQLL